MTLRAEQCHWIRDFVQSQLEKARFPEPLLEQTEESYVAKHLRPFVSELIRQKFRDLIVTGEGGVRVTPVHFLNFYFYPDIAVMYYDQRVAAFEAKYINFADSRGDLATAVGQAAIYTAEGYCSSLIIAIGSSRHSTFETIAAENKRLEQEHARWRICLLKH